MDGGVGINVMTIPAMRYLHLKIDKPCLVTLKMANKRVIRPERVISNEGFYHYGFPCGIRGRWGLSIDIR